MPSTVFSRFGALLMAASLAGCLSTPPSSMVKLSRLSPLEADPGQIAIAVMAPEQLHLREGDVRFGIRFDGNEPKDSFISEVYPVIGRSTQQLRGIDDDVPSGYHLYEATLSPQDAAEFRKAQQRAKALREAGVRGKGSISLSATGCAAAPIPDGPVYVSTYLRTQTDDDFIVLNRKIDLRSALAGTGNGLESIKPCDQAS